MLEIMSAQINELATALSKAQAEIMGAHKDSTNPHFKSRYADLESVWDACRAPLSKYGLSVIQTTHEESGRYYLRTLLAHSSGQYVRGETPILMMKQDMQALGSAITYARRYGLAAIVGVTPSDDDANLAVGKEVPAPASKKTYSISEEVNAALDVITHNFQDKDLLGKIKKLYDFTDRDTFNKKPIEQQRHILEQLRTKGYWDDLQAQ